VSDKEIINAVSLLAKLEGIFVEPAAATTIAGLKKLVEEREIDPFERVVCVITGMGLKYPEVTRTLVKGSEKLEELLSRMERRKYTTPLGETKRHILRIISKRESYGYGIWKTLKEFGIKVKIPSVYQHLVELERSGLIIRGRSEQTLRKTERNYYRLTEKGKTVLVQLEKIGT
jgi:DNA-binding MarR family transcriptional regulator